MHTNLNGYAPSMNGHDHLANGHEVSYDPQQVTLPWERIVPAKEQEVPTAKKESPVAEPANTDKVSAEKKTKRMQAVSMNNTLTHCAMFIATAITLGTRYATNSALCALTNLQSMLSEGNTMISDVAKSETKYKYAVAFRKEAFKPLEAMLTRILAEIVLSGASDATVNQVRTLIRKLRGARAVAKNPNVPVEDYHSVSQQNYDDVVANFERLVLMAAEDPNYAPVVEDITIVAMQNTVISLRGANTDVITAKAELDAARVTRNNFFNAEVTGLVDVFLTAKKVVLSNCGFTSEEYKKVKGLSFTRIRS